MFSTLCCLIVLPGFTEPSSSPTGVTAYPIPPRPLRMLVHETEFIVTAEVKEPATDVAPPKRVFPETNEKVRSATVPGGVVPTVVTLEVDRVLKGDPGTRTIEQTNYTMICPAPARYEVGTRVMAFLDRAKSGGFTTHALSYGAKTLTEEPLELYVQRVKEQLEIEGMPNDEKRLAAQVEWLVRCSESSATRWEGAYELCRTGDFMSHYEDGEEALPDFRRHLTADQRRRLLDALLVAVEFESGEQCLEELFRADRDPRLLAWLVARLRECHAEVEHDSYCTAALLVERIAVRDDHPEIRELAAAFEKNKVFTETESHGRERLNAVRAILDLY